MEQDKKLFYYEKVLQNLYIRHAGCAQCTHGAYEVQNRTGDAQIPEKTGDCKIKNYPLYYRA